MIKQNPNATVETDCLSCMSFSPEKNTLLEGIHCRHGPICLWSLYASKSRPDEAKTSAKQKPSAKPQAAIWNLI